MKKLVLLVDDEEIIRLTSGEILEELGFEVLVAGTGNEGIESFKAKHGEISAVILDMTLPDIPGLEVFTEMQKIPTGVKFLLTSGRQQDISNLGKNVMFIQKPYTIMELSSKLDEMIG